MNRQTDGRTSHGRTDGRVTDGWTCDQGKNEKRRRRRRRKESIRLRVGWGVFRSFSFYLSFTLFSLSECVCLFLSRYLAPSLALALTNSSSQKEINPPPSTLHPPGSRLQAPRSTLNAPPSNAPTLHVQRSKLQAPPSTQTKPFMLVVFFVFFGVLRVLRVSRD